MNVPVISHQWSESVPLPLLLPGQGGVEQLQMVERLRQLRAWQVQQQEGLLRRQQEQLARLRGEQGTAGRETKRPTTSPALTTHDRSPAPPTTVLKSIENVPLSSQQRASPHKLTQELNEGSVAPPTDGEEASVDKERVAEVTGSAQVEEPVSEGTVEHQAEVRTHTLDDERPINPGIGEFGYTTTSP